MNAAKYIRYILTIATALLFFSACKDDKNESQPTDFILRVDESVSIKLPNSTSYTITTNNSAISYELSGKILTVTAIKEGKATLTVILDSGESHNYSFTISANSYQMGFTIDSTPRIEFMDIRLDRQNGRNGRTPSELRARHGYNRLSDRQIDTLLWIYLCRNRETFTIFCTRRFFPKRDFKQRNHGYP